MDAQWPQYYEVWLRSGHNTMSTGLDAVGIKEEEGSMPRVCTPHRGRHCGRRYVPACLDGWHATSIVQLCCLHHPSSPGPAPLLVCVWVIAKIKVPVQSLGPSLVEVVGCEFQDFTLIRSVWPWQVISP